MVLLLVMSMILMSQREFTPLRSTAQAGVSLLLIVPIVFFVCVRGPKWVEKCPRGSVFARYNGWIDQHIFLRILESEVSKPDDSVNFANKVSKNVEMTQAQKPVEMP